MKLLLDVEFYGTKRKIFPHPRYNRTWRDMGYLDEGEDIAQEFFLFIKGSIRSRGQFKLASLTFI